MSLNVDWSRVSPPLTEEEKDRDAFNIGVILLALGTAKVGDKAADVIELVARARFYETLFEPLLNYADGRPSPVGTVDYWRRWIGLRVNGAQESRAVWTKRMVGNAWNEIDYKLRQEV